MGDQGESIVLLWSKEAEVAATALMQRVAAVKGEAGLHFAGVPMTIQKAIQWAQQLCISLSIFPLTFARISPHLMGHNQPTATTHTQVLAAGLGTVGS